MEHVAAVKIPVLHELVPDTVYPALHVGWHVDPLARVLVQSPTPPFVGGVDASHGFGEHVAAVKVPALHELVPDTVYPELHVGWHVDPCRSADEQSPTPPFRGGVDASQLESQVVSAPAGSSPAAFVSEARHATHDPLCTLSSLAQNEPSQVVSMLDASSPARLVRPPEQETHALLTTF